MDEGLRGLPAAVELTRRVAALLVGDVHVRAAMKLSQTVLPAPVDDNPYDRWAVVVGGFLEQAVSDGDLPPGTPPHELAAVVVQSFFGAYMIADELGRLSTLQDDIDRMWVVVAAPRFGPNVASGAAEGDIRSKSAGWLGSSGEWAGCGERRPG